MQRDGRGTVQTLTLQGYGVQGYEYGSTSSGPAGDPRSSLDAGLCPIARRNMLGRRRRELGSVLRPQLD
jgi:hypothetical protein